MERERKLLQQTVALAAIIPAATGLYGILFGQALTGDAVSISAESHFRFLSGLLFGIGLCFWSTVPGIEDKTNRFRLLTLIVVIGGLGRLVGLGLTGLPSLFMIGGLVMELIVTPVLCLWQTRIANRHAEEYAVAAP
ncbi:DUF4345 domain-containing protein [Microvirga sp. GCM10011540]|uniref:DUF4345 domain-containing protein n=1 Tax=Microvirga sp. GCM10011540 TaxID=3317338 RepID=UPI00360F9E91